MKRSLNLNVEQAARNRIQVLLQEFENFYVSFSGGKDSGVLLNLVIEEARKQGKLPVDVLIVDLEGQFHHTVEFIEKMVSKKEVNPFWVCLPLSLRNAVSQIQPKWICWDPEVEQLWVRQKPSHKSVIDDEDFFPFYYFGMEFEEFVDAFGQWHSTQKKGATVCLIGNRANESLNRYNTVKNSFKKMLEDYKWTTKSTDYFYKAYPIYDWHVKDVWAANGRFGWSYNHIYDLMQMAGLSLTKQRLCQPFGDDQRKSLWLYQILEPYTWQKLVKRVAGVNFGCKYSKNQSHVLGYYKFDLPNGHSYRSYSKFLLSTMPNHLAKHYRERIFKFLNWWRVNGKKKGVYRIPDYADKKLEAQKKVPSWRRICKVLIKNDYWCRGLSFSQTKKLTTQHLEVYENYLRRVQL
jgi:predicted phosphoadenosine phosphosulfate sulfurtransferase